MISIIIPIYIANKKLLEIVERCLRSLEMSTDKLYDLVTVDDDSPIPYPATIKHKFNTGYAKSVNDGLRTAKGDVLIVANDDIEFVEGTLEKLSKILEDTSIGIASLPTSDEDIQLTGGYVEDAKFGSIWATRRDVLESVGLLDEDFPHYFNDTEFYQRVRKQYRIVKDTSLVIPHIGKATYSIVDPNDELYHQAMKKYEAKFGRID
jgi:GT2 family glycosyltransferase